METRMDDNDAPIDGRPIRSRRRARVAVVVLVLAVAFAVALVQVARLAAERVLSATLGTPVAIGALWWAPWNGRVSAERVAIGRGDDQLTARRIAAVVNPFRVSREAITIGTVEVDQPTGPVQVNQDYHLVVPALGRGASASAGAPPHVTIRELVVNGGALSVRYPVRDTTRTAPLSIDRFAATDVELTPAPSGARLGMSGQFKGTIGAAPVQGDLQVLIAGADTQVAGDVAVTGFAVNRDVVPLPRALDTFTGTVDARAAIQIGGARPAPALQVDVRVVDAHLAGAEGSEISAHKALLRKVRVDLSTAAIDLGPVTVEEPLVVATLTDSGLVLPLPASAGTGAPSWSVSSGTVEAQHGTIRINRGDAGMALALESARYDGLREGRPSRFVATLRAEDGGSIAAEGTLAADPPSLQVTARVERLALAPLIALGPAPPIALARGTVDGEVRMAVRHGRLQRVEGELTAHDVHTAPPDPQYPTEVMAVHAAALELALETDPSLAIDVSRMTLSYPYALIQRRAAGIFPYMQFAPDQAATGGNADAPRLRVRHLEATDGRVEFVDMTLDPPYWSSFTDVSAQADELHSRTRTVEHFKISGKQDELSPATISGALTERGLNARIEMTDVLLASLNAYIAPILGYELISGRLSITASAEPVPPMLESFADVVLSGVDVRQTGIDVIREQSGVPLPIALGLIANPAGEIHLTLPLTVDPSARSVSLGSVVWQGVRSAIVGALSTPLRLLGSLFGKEGAPHAFAIDPIPFPAGKSSLDRAGEARIAQIARILQAHGTLALVVLPQLTAEDIDDVGAARATRLADARTEAVRNALTGANADPRIAPERLLPVSWSAEMGAQATGRPGVYVELQEGAWATPEPTEP
jgi:hypothetical protein